jgi:hypothetical protein
MYFFRTFKKSTAPYKVHNMGLRYIKNFLFATMFSLIYVFQWQKRLKLLYFWQKCLETIQTTYALFLRTYRGK